MQYEANTPAEYMDALAPDWRRKTVAGLRSLIKANGPDLVEDIHYKMLGYADAAGYVFHLNAQKSYVSLYVGDTGRIDPEGDLLAGINCGKGCIRFKKSNEIDQTRIDEFITRALALRASGETFEC